ncbi:hypothetical protein [Flavobacterium frigoris]|uniref:Uncharacterized protein n=1 Tax=Flavobacterium frigoris TaxID=229204 RepID=A0A1H9F7V9_FLAFI|nr:hypothetical protein [Flavobacterium frigoris]SEQ33967.1 hypothetical protein SAMN05444355_102103 [Flavobacterium frigoris]
MNNFSKCNYSKKTLTIFFLFLFVLVSNVSVFSQSSGNSVVESTTNNSSNEVKEDNKAASNVEFVLWFMGSKQDPNSTISNEGINTKKQIMTSGLAPNRLLIKAFLKKAVNFEIAIA